MQQASSPAGHCGRSTTEPYSSAFGGLIALATALGIGRFVYTPIVPAMISAT
jgi:hypothetical protein